ncbi:porin family protein [Balneolales bacterium ANBcel1]|nr:porin family protein [Balneolales bacterium ANBcel1]
MNSFSNYTMTAVIAVFFLFGAADTSRAQYQFEQKPITFGISTGLTVSDLWGDDVGGTDVRAGFTGGLFMNYRLTPYFSIQPEANFVMKHSQVNDGVLGEGEKTRYLFNYLEIPVLLKGHLYSGSALTPNIYAGPALAINLSDDDVDDLRSVDFGFAFGGGFDIYRTVMLDLRYTLGVVDLFDVPADPSAKNGTFAVTLGIGF